MNSPFVNGSRAPELKAPVFGGMPMPAGAANPAMPVLCRDPAHGAIVPVGRDAFLLLPASLSGMAAPRVQLVDAGAGRTNVTVHEDDWEEIVDALRGSVPQLTATYNTPARARAFLTGLGAGTHNIAVGPHYVHSQLTMHSDGISARIRATGAVNVVLRERLILNVTVNFIAV